MDVCLQLVESVGFLKCLLVHVQALVHFNHHGMIFHRHLKSFTVGEWRVDSNLVATGIEMLLDIADDDCVWASCIVIKPDTDVNIGWIAIQQIGPT